MRQYFTYRLLPVPNDNSHYTPERILRTCFNGLDFTYHLEIVTNDVLDSRRLGYIEVPDTGDPLADQDKVDSILEALQGHGLHKKTIEKAQEFVTYLVGIVPTIDGGKLVFSEIPPEV